MSKNIGRENASDPHFRYKRPVVQAKVEGRGNGIKTNVVNNKDIARALARPADYLLKYFGFELGAQTNYKDDTGLSIVNGQHTAGDLEKLVDDFIDHFVLCKSCKNPETEMKVTKRITMKCKACGAKSGVNEHRLNTYIYKHPPAKKESKEEKKVRERDEQKLRNLQDQDAAKSSAKKDKNGKKKKSQNEDGDGGDDEDEAIGESSAGTTQVVSNGMGESLSAADSAPVNGGDTEGLDVGGAVAEDDEDEDEVWATDTSAAAVALRAQQQLTGAAARMVESAVEISPEEREAAENLERLTMLISKQAPAPDVFDVLAKAAGTNRGEQMKLLYRLVLATDTVPFKAAEKHLNYLTYRSDMKSQAAQLIGLEAVLYEQPIAAPQVKNLFMTLYNEDVLQAETIIYWFEHPELGSKLNVPAEASQNLREVLQASVDEIREDEEDEDEDDEEE